MINALNSYAYFHKMEFTSESISCHTFHKLILVLRSELVNANVHESGWKRKGTDFTDSHKLIFYELSPFANSVPALKLWRKRRENLTRIFTNLDAKEKDIDFTD
ncbi:MAG: hypothetical protein K0S32_905 [Bacteroidetes bacterium]|jgi:hypothetical protein|nr:hypothetical protein [Bacteroidota bacterium]